MSTVLFGLLSSAGHYALDYSKCSEDDAGSNHDAEDLADESGLCAGPAGSVKAHAGGDAADNHEDDNTHCAH